jgi:proteasome beta subunit
MATIVGIECTDGVLLAGDRTLVEEGTVRSTDKRHVFELGDVGVAVAGSAAAIDSFERELDAELRRYRTDQSEVRIDPLARITSNLAASTGASAIVAAPDEEGVPRLRSVGDDGSILDDDWAALGTGQSLALGQLEAAAEELSLEAADDLVDEIFEALAERDTDTGDDVDRFRLHADAGERTDAT